jgi:serine/threonine protein kinase
MVTTVQPQPSTSAVLECPFNIEILKDERGREAYFGTGAWSIVYKATTHAKQRHGSIGGQFGHNITPPHSPTPTSPVLVAVKKPTRRDAAEILQSEAKTLSYLHTIPESDRFVVPFYGVIDVSTLVLGAIPYSLDEHIRRCAALASQQVSNWTSTEPVIGSAVSWLTLAHKLITALAWLHTQAGVVHGDIKPGNILLSPQQAISSNENEFPYEPIFADFSSSQLLPSPASPCPTLTPNTLSAVTREFTAPELLSSAVLRDPNSTATPATDVFSLAVTLLVAVTGQLLVYPGSVFQRQAMATQGWGVLNFVRNGEGGLRVPRAGLVERVLEGVVKKNPAERIGVKEWVGVVEAIGKAENGRL